MSRLSLAHTALENNAKRNKIGLLKARKVLLNSPGFTLGRGNTVDDLLKELEKWKFIKINKHNVIVNNW